MKYTQEDVRRHGLEGLIRSVQNITDTELVFEQCALALIRNPHDMARLFAAIPPPVQYLYLTNNGLGELSIRELKSVLSNIGSSVRRIDVRYNDFELKSNKALGEIFSALPETVTKIKFCDKGFWVDRTVISERYPAPQSEKQPPAPQSEINYNFYFKCLCGLSLMAGAYLVISALIAASVLAVGMEMAVVGGIGCYLATKGIFSQKPENTNLTFAIYPPASQIPA